MRFLPLLVVTAALFVAPSAQADGSFTSSDPLLNRIWAASVKTATDMLAPGPLTVDFAGHPCAIDEPVVILDGNIRDRCPYIGDEAVTGMTLLVSTPSATTAIRNELDWFAANQHSDGSVPASPLAGGDRVLFDYESYWVQCLYDYVLYTGDRSLASHVWPNLVALMDTWYPSKARSDGLVVNDLGASDYASIRRQGTLIAYFNAGYALALEQAAQIATWIGNTANARTWKTRAASLASPFNATFWDAKAGAYVDSPTGQVVHPEDGNVFAILAGFTSPARAASALNYLSHVNSRPYGNTIADNNTWDYPAVWGSNAKDRVFPFIGYFELLARFQGRARRLGGRPDPPRVGIHARARPPVDDVGRHRPMGRRPERQRSILGSRLVERSGSGADELRPRRETDEPWLRHVHRRSTPREGGHVSIRDGADAQRRSDGRMETREQETGRNGASAGRGNVDQSPCSSAPQSRHPVAHARRPTVPSPQARVMHGRAAR